MGICKCKKRSEDFCFNHKKFICDSCVVVDHSICYIKSYVDWLTDCEFEESICGVCKGRFDADDSEDSVRLGCYHLFHPECIDVYVATLSQNTSPQLYPCPKCSEPILPSNDKQSPLANTIREKFSLSSWSENYLNQFKKFNSNNESSNGVNGMMNGSHTNGYTNGHNNNHHHGSTLSHTSNSNNISPQSSEFYTNLDVLKNNGSNVNSGGNSIINPNLLEETPPLSHLNPLYSVASRKHDDTIIQLGNSNTGNIGNSIHGNNKIYDDYDKYNKRPSSTLSKILNPIKEIPTKYLILIVIMSFVFLVLLLKMNSAQSLDDGEIDNNKVGGGGALDNGIINKDDNNIQNDQKQIIDQQL